MELPDLRQMTKDDVRSLKLGLKNHTIQDIVLRCKGWSSIDQALDVKGVGTSILAKLKTKCRLPQHGALRRVDHNIISSDEDECQELFSSPDCCSSPVGRGGGPLQLLEEEAELSEQLEALELPNTPSRVSWIFSSIQAGLSSIAHAPRRIFSGAQPSQPPVECNQQISGQQQNGPSRDCSRYRRARLTCDLQCVAAECTLHTLRERLRAHRGERLRVHTQAESTH